MAMYNERDASHDSYASDRMIAYLLHMVESNYDGHLLPNVAIFSGLMRVPHQ